MQATNRFSKQAISNLRSEIQEADHNEVFALGFLSPEGKIERVEVVARGQEQRVLALPTQWERADVLIHNHPSGFLTPSDNDMIIAASAGEIGVGSYIVDNDVSSVYVVVEPTARRSIEPLNEEKIVASLQEGGAIARRLSNYEIRPSQLDLMRMIIRSFNENAIACAEAGTGVGKSFAYLIPAMAFAAQNTVRIVVSTATITLQQQLFEKDIPLVASAMKKKVKAVLVKGRSNYLCWRRLKDALREGNLFDAPGETLHELEQWANSTQTGSRSELSFLPDENVWSRVCSESDLCLGPRCSERDHCFYLSLRREAVSAQILVVNHHLLFADLAARKDGAGYENTVVLPPYDRVVVDEAHSIEDAATSFFSEDFSRPALLRQLGRLYRRRGVQILGLLPRLVALLGNEAALDEPLNSLGDEIQGIREGLEIMDRRALDIMGSEGVYRLTEQKSQTLEALLFPVLRELGIQLGRMVSRVRELLENVEETFEDDQTVWEIQGILRRIDGKVASISTFLEYADRSDTVAWMERRRGSTGDSWVRCILSPIDVAPELAEALFESHKTVLNVSATLTVANSFQYYFNRSGIGLLEGKTILSGQFPSPFPYEKAVLLGCPTDAPSPDTGAYQDFVDTAIPQLISISGGSALVLFTSYDALRSAYRVSEGILRDLGIRCFKQGDEDRSRLLQKFLQDESSVLFATDSFWEGVDAPGDTLRLVILCRLPFRTPNDPVFEARREALEKRGGNAFMELSLPESVMKFKQGFGRLMRRSSDHGVVVVLDNRILHKRYGSLFIRSLPQTKQCFADFKTLLRQTEAFLYP